MNIKAGCVAAIVLAAAACIPPPSGYRWYYVRKGDTLWSISRTSRTDVFKLIYANNIKTPSLIYPGMRLKIPAAGGGGRIKKGRAKSAGSDKDRKISSVPETIGFSRPVKGKIIRKFGKSKTHRYLGIVIQAKNRNIVSSYGGKVSFAGTVSGFGTTVIVEHPSDYHTVYGYLSDITVKTGDSVGKGSLIGHAGRSGSFKNDVLYFEIRHKTEAYDPLLYFE